MPFYLLSDGSQIDVFDEKWTRAVNNEFKLAHGVCARKHNRDAYFLAYMDIIDGITEVCY